MELKKLICSCCGGELVIKDDTHYLCPYCKALYEKDNAEEIQEILSNALEQDKLERLSNARRVLYDATIKTKYPSKVKVLAATTNVLSINPDDVFAQVVSYSYEDEYELTNLLPALELDHATAEQVYHWLMRDIYPRIVGPLGDFIQRHFEGEEYAEKLTALEDEAEKEQEGYYLSTLPRDVFICYSSKDMPEVIHIMDVLEENGFSCFAAFRNLRHGKEAQEDYWNEITQAMEACKTLIFISSKNSRYIKCDAITKELPYLARNLDDKPRFEYMLDRGDHVADLVQDVLKEAFPTQERVHDESTLVRRVKYLLDELKAPKKKQSDIALEEFNKKQAELDAKLKALEEAERKRQERLEAEEKAKAEKEAARLAKEQEEAKRKQEEALLKAKKEQEEKLLREQKAKEEAERKEQERLAEQKARQEAEERRLKELEERLAKQLEEKYKGVPTPEQKYSESAPKKEETKREISLSKDFIKKSEFVDLGDKYINFGYYPQKKVTDILLMKTLDRLTADNNGLVNHDGQLFGKTNNQYFSFEPIKWKIVIDEDSKTTLISESIIDFKRFDSRGADYEYSDIREYLNNDFIRISFASSGPEIIKNNHNDKVGLATDSFVKFLNSDNPKVTDYCLTKQKETNQDLSICLEDGKYVTGRLSALDKTSYYGVRAVITIKYTSKYYYQRLELEKFKSDTKEELETFILNEDSSNYLPELWIKAEKSFDDCIKNIDLAKNKGEVKYVKDNVINEINKYKKESQESFKKFNNYKEQARRELDDLDKNVKDKYAWDVWKSFNNLLYETYKKFDTAQKREEIDFAKKEVLKFASTLDKKQQEYEITSARENASKKLNDLLKEKERRRALYSSENYEKISKTIKGYLTRVSSLTDKEKIYACANSALSEVDKVLTIEQIEKERAEKEAKLKQEQERKAAEKYLNDNFEIKNNVLVKYKGREEAVVIPKTITKIASKAFANNLAVKTVSILHEIESIDSYAFSHCENLTSIVIRERLKDIGTNAFEYCISLVRISIPEGIEHLNDFVFYNCSSLREVYLPDSLKTIEEEALSGCGSLASIDIPKAVTYIGRNAFNMCISLKKVTLPDSLNTLDYGAFGDCYILEEINIPSSVTSIGEYAFSECEKIKSITIPDNIKVIPKYAFCGCKSLKTINIPDGVTSIGENSFADCASLETIKLPNGVLSIDYGAFSHCTSLKNINIPDGVNRLGSTAFYQCSSLESIYIPGSVTSIEKGTFYECESLKEVNLPYGITSIGSFAFYDCRRLKSITIHGCVKSIGEGAFKDCYSLTSITIPSSVTSIGDSAFASCIELENVYANNPNEIKKLVSKSKNVFDNTKVKKGLFGYDIKQAK